MAVHKNVPFTASFSITFGPQNINLVGNIHLMGPVILLDIKNYKFVGGRPGRVVIGDDLCSRGQGFESWHHILDGLTLFTIDLLWTLYGLFEKTENKQKEVGVGPFKKIISSLQYPAKRWPCLAEATNCVKKGFKILAQNTDKIQLTKLVKKTWADLRWGENFDLKQNAKLLWFIQCDQMTRLLWPFTAMKIYPIVSEICQSRIKILPNTKMII